MRGLALAAWLLFGAVLWSACPPKPPVPTPLPDGGSLAYCRAPSAVASAADVCDGMFTAAGFACVRCANQVGCVDGDAQIYCTNGPCASDPACKLEHEDGLIQKRKTAPPR